MGPFAKIKRGMGIGGWMTNYKRVRFLPAEKAFDITIGDREHFERYITQWDIQNIRSFGMDHIRIPFDQCVIEEVNNPFSYREEMLKLLDRVIHWSLNEGLEVILNMHHAFGCYCDFAEGSSLLDDEELKTRFIRLWEMLEDRYCDLDIVFEPLNEVTSANAEKWNDLAGRTIKALREKNATRRIIIGSACWNNVNYLKDLSLYDDPYIGYTFHFYEPATITHQRSTVFVEHYLYNREIPYPCDISYLKDFEDCFNRDGKWLSGYDRIDERFVQDYLQPAADFKRQHPDKWLWFGEFGTIQHMPLESRENYMRDVIRFSKEHDIPWCSWNYLSTPYDCNKYSLVTEDDRKIVSEEMLRIIQGHV